MKEIMKKIGMFFLRLLGGIGSFFKKLWNHRQGRVGLIIAGILIVCAVFAPIIAPYDPYDVTQRAEKGLSPSWEHLLGTSITTGQDIFSMLIYGARSSLSIGVITGITIAVLGSILGIAAGYVLSACFGMIDLSAIGTSGLFSLPKIAPFGIKFEFSSSLAFSRR